MKCQKGNHSKIHLDLILRVPIFYYNRSKSRWSYGA